MTSPFKTYERTVRQTKNVATVTADNIGQIAAIIKGHVDYSGDEPVLVVPSQSRPWKVKVGWEVELYASDPPSIANANGFNRDGDWHEAD